MPEPRNSPTQSTELPEKAVELAAIAVDDALRNSVSALQITPKKQARIALQAAAPALRQQGADQERQRLKEALLSDEAVRAIYDRMPERLLDLTEDQNLPPSAARMTRFAIRAALDTLGAG